MIEPLFFLLLLLGSVFIFALLFIKKETVIVEINPSLVDTIWAHYGIEPSIVTSLQLRAEQLSKEYLKNILVVSSNKKIAFFFKESAPGCIWMDYLTDTAYPFLTNKKVIPFDDFFNK